MTAPLHSVPPADDGVAWEDPGPRPRGARGPVWPSRLAPLMERPGQWARVATRPAVKSAYQTVGDLRGGRVAIPAGRWEFTSRGQDDGSGAVYARYLGPDETAS